MWSPRWRKRWKALRRAQSPIMLSLNLPQDLGVPHAYRRGRGGRIKRRPALPKRTALNRRDHAKIASPAQRRVGPKRSNSAGICVEAGECFSQQSRRMLEMAVGEARQRYLPALAVQKARN